MLQPPSISLYIHVASLPSTIASSLVSPPGYRVHLQANQSCIRNEMHRNQIFILVDALHRPYVTIGLCILVYRCLCTYVCTHVCACRSVRRASLYAPAEQYYCFLLGPSSAVPMFLNMSSGLQLTSSVFSSGRAGGGGNCGAAGSETVRPLA